VQSNVLQKVPKWLQKQWAIGSRHYCISDDAIDITDDVINILV